MHYILHLFGFLPQLSPGQVVMTVVVWIGCYLWKTTTNGTKVPVPNRLDNTFGVQVTVGSKGSGRASTRRGE